MELTADLNTEQIVTKILTSNEILKRNNENLSITSPINLGDYLSNLPSEELVQNTVENKPSKYTFIKEGMWKF